MAYNIIGKRGNERPEVLETVHNRPTALNLIHQVYSQFNEGSVVQWKFFITQQ